MSDITAQPQTFHITPVALEQQAHAYALLYLLDHYASGPMGGSNALDENVKATLIPALAARSDYIGFLAFSNALPVGLINCFEGFSTFAARPLLNIHDIIVHTDFHGQGIGTLLLQRTEQAAKQKNYCKLTLEVLAHNQAALQLYRRAGFQPYQLTEAAGQALFMHKIIPD